MKNLKTDSNKILLIGIGNSGRGDDGLGWAFADCVKSLGLNFIDFEYRYQLQIEDSLAVSRYDRVIFADASHEQLDNGFTLKACTPVRHYFFSSHMQSPETILYLSDDLFGKLPEAHTLAITGKDWELKTTLSRVAESNLVNAFDFFIKDFLPTVHPGFSGSSWFPHNSSSLA
jgi:hydrogenase maturation protease